jgi:hypothetical protein
MGVEPTLDQEAGRATVLKTVEQVFRRSGWPRRVVNGRLKVATDGLLQVNPGGQSNVHAKSDFVGYQSLRGREARQGWPHSAVHHLPKLSRRQASPENSSQRYPTAQMTRALLAGWCLSGQQSRGIRVGLPRRIPRALGFARRRALVLAQVLKARARFLAQPHTRILLDVECDLGRPSM